MPTPAVEEKLKTLPARPGCYLYKGEQGEILYVGKAINLRNRVRSYFQKGANLTPKVRRLVSKIADLEVIVCDSELEALVLECSLIKKHRPPFNVRLRDDKQYPYLCLTTSEPFPRLILTRRVRQDKNRYFGPYPNSRAVRTTMELINRIFPLISCGKPFDGSPVRKPCLYYHLGQCMAPCAGLADKNAYLTAVKEVIDFLEGRQEHIVQRLKQQMEEAAENLEFERAARLRDQWQAVEETLQRQKVLTTERIDQDVIAVVEDNTGLKEACVQMFFIRGGKLIGQNHFLVEGTEEESLSDVVREFLKQYYQDAASIPQEILLPCDIDEMEIVRQWLRQKRGKKVEIHVPVRGERKRLVEMATENALHALEQIKAEMRARLDNTEQALKELAEALGLAEPPQRIECYDISNTQGQHQVASMVVCEKGEMMPQEYRRFKIKRSDGKPNDYASIHEVIARRLKEAKQGNPKFTRLPSLIIVDGGRGQVSAAEAAMEEVNLHLPLAGLAKQFEHLYLPGEPDPVILPRNSQALYLVQRIRDEAHRFANTFGAKVRQRAQTHSILEEIPGIGPKRRRALQLHFGGLAKIRAATIEELAAVPGMTLKLATQLYETLHPNGFVDEVNGIPAETTD
ncbi:excinuclease ABC subunit UvrC [Chthonomonas calidirosea]|uniref:UvrABC system protein C n=1 Tax=Chthonomonas calidirosea (strain DSM 23976 / ICMP 18418 / T49) TaxID=1303518 RepID=S0EYB9_CHTCT|nr:excinuclease ABC subunit UvrC [Chthonomonas calidirosea]CCW35315.1 Excinuclease ABC subunit C [Chthonomonas calidirosea T49]CEK19667.1 Excinuclease ABC subunit C [Chthonomonas calidirosea]CEK20630.1 Excinuclease ABC subunit C [Chthonomonas calidirosea]